MDLVGFFLAASLLTYPPDEVAFAPDPNLFDVVRGPMQILAVEQQILDPREMRYVLNSKSEFSGDLNLLRRRQVELSDVPLAEDAARFPERVYVNEFLAINRAFRQHCDIAQYSRPDKYWDFRVTVQEVDYLYQVWDTVRDAKCEYYYVTVRRQALKKLREMLGEADYYSATLPLYVPLEKFRRIIYP